MSGDSDAIKKILEEKKKEYEQLGIEIKALETVADVKPEPEESQGYFTDAVGNVNKAAKETGKYLKANLEINGKMQEIMVLHIYKIIY